MSTRELTGHKVDGVPCDLRIEVVDELGSGANQHYRATDSGVLVADLHFASLGMLGLTNEALIAIVMDRLRGFQRGELKCSDNAMAINYLKAGLDQLHARALDRVERGVEGTHQK